MASVMHYLRTYILYEFIHIHIYGGARDVDHVSGRSQVGLCHSPIEPFTNQVHAILVEPFTNLQYWWLVGNPRLLLQHKVQQTCFKNVHIMPAHA